MCTSLIPSYILYLSHFLKIKLNLKYLKIKIINVVNIFGVIEILIVVYRKLYKLFVCIHVGTFKN